MPLPGFRESAGRKRLDVRSFAVFKKLELIAHSVVEGFISGQHKSPFKGFAIEFAEHRNYSPGDDLKHLDWKLAAKLDRYYIKQYEEETSLRAYIVLDRSGSMGYSSGKFSKMDCSRFVAGVLSYMLIGQEDAVGLVTCTSKIENYLPPRSTKTHLKNIIEILDNSDTGEDTGLGNVLHALANRIKRRGLIVIISDLFDDPNDIIRALNHFSHKKHEIVVYQILDRKEADFPFRDMTRFESMEGEQFELIDPLRIKREYVKQFKHHQNLIKQACHRLHVDFVQMFTDEPVERSLARYLAGRLKR